MDTFSALAEPTRRNILEVLAAQGKMPASAISHRFSVTQSAISQHLKVLREAKLVMMEKKSQQRLYQVNPAVVNEVAVWAEHLRQLETNYLKRMDKHQL